MSAFEIVDNKQRAREIEERKRQEAARWEQLRLAAKRPEREGWYGDRPIKRMRFEDLEDERREDERKRQAEVQKREEAERRRKLSQSRYAIIEKAAQLAKEEADRKAAEIAEAAAKAKARQEKLERWEKKKAEKAAKAEKEKAEKADKGKKKALALSAEEKEKLKEKRLLKLLCVPLGG